jgi:hypothetical protein
MLGTLTTIGGNYDIIFAFGIGILLIYVLGAMLVTGVQAIREFLNQT